MAEENFFKNVYPFTTEMISGYIKELDVKGKRVLTVGSSCDQAFNALLLGAKHVTVYDISPNVEEFYELKWNMIMRNTREKLCQELCKTKKIPLMKDIHGLKTIQQSNLYLQNDENYEKLKTCLLEEEIEFIQGNVFNMDETIREERYDCMILSNILQYIDIYAQGEDPYLFLAQKFQEWKKHLNMGGIIQLLYLYHYSLADLKEKTVINLPVYHLNKVVEALNNEPLEILLFDGISQGTKDSIVTYTKKR